MAGGLTPRGVLEKFSAVQRVDVHLPTTDGREVILTRHTQPEKELLLPQGSFRQPLPFEMLAPMPQLHSPVAQPPHATGQSPGPTRSSSQLNPSSRRRGTSRGTSTGLAAARPNCVWGCLPASCCAMRGSPAHRERLSRSTYRLAAIRAS